MVRLLHIISNFLGINKRCLSRSVQPNFKVPEMGPHTRHLAIGMPASPGLDFCGRVVMSGPDAAFVIGQLAYVSWYAEEVWCAGWSLSNSASWIVAIHDAASVGIAGQSTY